MTALTIAYEHGRIRRTEHSSTVEARRELIRFSERLHLYREGTGQAGQLLQGSGMYVSRVAGYQIEEVS